MPYYCSSAKHISHDTLLFFKKINLSKDIPIISQRLPLIGKKSLTTKMNIMILRLYLLQMAMMVTFYLIFYLSGNQEYILPA